MTGRGAGRDGGRWCLPLLVDEGCVASITRAPNTFLFGERGGGGLGGAGGGGGHERPSHYFSVASIKNG